MHSLWQVNVSELAQGEAEVGFACLWAVGSHFEMPTTLLESLLWFRWLASQAYCFFLSIACVVFVALVHWRPKASAL